MKLLFILLACVSASVAVSLTAYMRPRAVFFDFNLNPNALDNWVENSDVQYYDGAGESKADMVFLENQNGMRAVFFGVADAAYFVGRASMRIIGEWDFSRYTSILINCRANVAQGQFYIVLRHREVHGGERQFYKAELRATNEFTTIELPLSSFISSRSDDDPLDTSYITSIAIALNAFEREINTGVLEINWIGAY